MYKVKNQKYLESIKTKTAFRTKLNYFFKSSYLYLNIVLFKIKKLEVDITIKDF